MIAIDVEREEDGRWMAECPDLAGMWVHGPTPEKAVESLLKLLRKVHPEALS